MRVNRDLLGWGVFLIVLGAIPLLVRGGYLDQDLVRRAWELWPLILVGIGLGLLLRRTPAALVGGLVVAITCGLMGGALISVGLGGGFAIAGCGSGDRTGTAFETRTGNLSTDARVVITLDCGELAATTAAGSAWSLSGTSEGGRTPEVDASGTEVTIATPDRRGFSFGRAGEDWQLTLPADPRLVVQVRVSAGSARLDLAGAHAADVDVEVNAGDVRLDLSRAVDASRLEAHANAGSISISLPAASMTGNVSANAGSVEVCVPDGTGIRLRSDDSALSGNNFADRGLTRSGATWTSPGYDTAATRIDLSANANLGSITLNPEDGCD